MHCIIDFDDNTLCWLCAHLNDTHRYVYVFCTKQCFKLFWIRENSFCTGACSVMDSGNNKLFTTRDEESA